MAAPDPAPAPLTSTPSRRPAWSRRFLLALAILLVGPALIVALYTWLALSFAYSNGERAGYVQKFSRKGWVCKTWEGELAMVSLPGTMAEVFRFTVRNDAVAGQINQAIGQRVALSYEEHRGLPTTCFGETTYFVVAVKPITP
jgi:hypothetical protein